MEGENPGRSVLETSEREGGIREVNMRLKRGECWDSNHDRRTKLELVMTQSNPYGM